MACRVLVVETDTGDIVSRAFSKFFNYHESNAYKPTGDELAVRVEEKLDGSIITLFCYQNQWILTSKARFDSVHVEMAQEILDEKYPRVTEKLSPDKTYVFELIHPKNPISLRYTYKDLVLLSVIGKDGSEPPSGFDWTVYPFRRPARSDILITDLDAMRKLNRVNEEGFVVKLYPRHAPLHPQRIKVKFESFLDLIKSKNYQTPEKLAQLYTRKRNAIHTFDEREVTDRMEREKVIYFEALRNIADDFGKKWVAGKLEMWLEIENVFIEAEAELRWVIRKLVDEGFDKHIGTKEREVRRRFVQRIMQEPKMTKYQKVLFIWFTGEPMKRQVETFTSSVKLKKTGTIDR